MDSAWYQPIAFTILFVACLLLGFFGADSRIGFGGNGRTDVKERWFIHSRHD
jgi:hypothetical protein